MRLSTYSDFSLRVLIHTAAKHPERVTIDQIAQTFSISRNHLVKIVHYLGKLGYLNTRRGAGGGFILKLPSESIRLGSVIRQTENQTALVECFNLQTNQCRLAPVCRLKGALAEAEKAFYGILDGYTLADLVENKSAIRALLQ